MDGRSISELLSEAVADATRVLVVSGPTFDERRRKANDVRAEVDDPASLQRLVVALDAERTDVALMMRGHTTIAFLAERKLLVAIECLDGFVRCPELWAHDAELSRPANLSVWLAAATTPGYA